MTEIAEIAAAASATIAPFMPFLVEAGKAGGTKLAEAIASKGGEAAWDKAQKLWDWIKSKFDETPPLHGAAIMLADQPEDETYQTVMAKALGGYLQKHPEQTKDLLALLGGKETIQHVLADRQSWVEDVTMEITGAGKQSVEAREGSVVKKIIMKSN